MKQLKSKSNSAPEYVPLYQDNKTEFYVYIKNEIELKKRKPTHICGTKQTINSEKMTVTLLVID